MPDPPIYVTQPSLAPLEEFQSYLQQIWTSGVMTHNGPFLQQLEAEVSSCIGVPDTVCVANGTLALQLAIRALGVQGEIITTPFTYAATACAIAWEQCTPVFVDIDPQTWNLDPQKIADAVTKNTVAIMPVHVFSAPCELQAIEDIARQHHLKVIYDAAHAMCVDVEGRSVMAYGDISCTSFHATKLFNTCEGGACFAQDPELNERMRRLRFFGHDDQKDVVQLGTNAKMTEIHAALGLANLKYLDEVRQHRRNCYERYQTSLRSLDNLQFQDFHADQYNFSYMPVLLADEPQVLQALDKLAERNIYPRRYFHPALHHTPAYAGAPRGSLAVAEDVASRALCLPLHQRLTYNDVDQICEILLHIFR